MRPGGKTRRRLVTFVPPVLVALLALPFVLRQNAWFEWSNAYWYLQRQTEYVAAHGRPTLFLQVQTGAFYPWFVYYAGPLVTVLAYPALVLGPWTTFVLATVASMVTGYLGIWWAARNLGLSRALAVLPGLTYAAAPYVVCDLYGRAAWPELVAVNGLAVLIGGLTALLVRPRGRDAGALAAITAAVVVIAGTHNLTLLMTVIVLPPALIAVVLMRPRGAVPLLPAAGRALVAGILGLGLVAAYLLPNLWYGRDTLIAQKWINDLSLAETFNGVESFSNLLAPWPKVPEQIPGRWVYPQGPTLVLAWVVVALVVVLVRRRRPLRLTASSIVLLALTGGLLILVANPRWWLHFPALLHTIQYPFRLLSYVAILVALGAIAGVRHLPAGGRGRQLGIGTLTVAVAVQVAGAAYVATASKGTDPQRLPAPRVADVHADTVPTAFGDNTVLTPSQFKVRQRPTVRGKVSKDVVFAMHDLLTSSTARISGKQRPGAQVLTPASWSPFLRITGDASLAGRDNDGLAVLRVDATGSDGEWHAKASAATPAPLAVGRAISAVSVLIVITLLAAAIVRARGRRRGIPEPTPATASEPVGVA
jgi:hypothetical protein